MSSPSSNHLLLMVCGMHLINDLLQALLPALYPLLREWHGLSYSEIGMLGLLFHLLGAIGQPLVGAWGDHRERTWPLPAALLTGLAGLILLALANTPALLLAATLLIGIGSALFHPEGARAVRRYAAGRFARAQSLFQLGGNLGSALGPLLVLALALPFGQPALLVLIPLALLGVWLGRRLPPPGSTEPAPLGSAAAPMPRGRLFGLFGLLSLLLVSKYLYLTALANYHDFYLIERFGFAIGLAQLHVFVLLAAIALGTWCGGPLADRFGNRAVIRVSVLGAGPLALCLPQAGPALALLLVALIGALLASAFPAIIVYAQQRLPRRPGLVAGYFFGLSFGVSGVTVAALGVLADGRGIVRLFELCAWVPMLGLLALALPAENGATSAVNVRWTARKPGSPPPR